MTVASIVIPVYNRAHLVGRAIESALSQTVACEVVVVDHGSTDSIDQIVSRYRGQIRYVRRPIDEGPIECWRDGFEQATGDYVHLTYDDDWLEPLFMERCLEAFDDDVAFVYTRVRIHSEESRHVRPSVLHPGGKLPVAPLVQHLLRRPLSLSPGCAVFRRTDALANLLPEVPGASGRFGKKSGVGEDLLLFLLTTLSYSAYVHVPEELADFLAHPGSITIGALQRGQAKSLEEAYERAKSHYLARPGSLARERGLRRAVSEVKWLSASGELPAYVRKGLRRLAR